MRRQPGMRRQGGMWRQGMWRQNAASAVNAASWENVASGNAASQVFGMQRQNANSASGGKALSLLRPPCKYEPLLRFTALSAPIKSTASVNLDFPAQFKT